MKTPDTSYAWAVDLAVSPATAVDQVTAALATQGFGVLTRIDAHEVLKKKLGIERAPYIILGACNPTFAHQAMEAEAAVGILLPCNVVIEGRGDGCRVWVGQPEALMAVSGRTDLAPLAAEVGRRLHAVAAALVAGTAP